MSMTKSYEIRRDAVHLKFIHAYIQTVCRNECIAFSGKIRRGEIIQKIFTLNILTLKVMITKNNYKKYGNIGNIKMVTEIITKIIMFKMRTKPFRKSSFMLSFFIALL
jgi:hypothetical protein